MYPRKTVGLIGPHEGCLELLTALANANGLNLDIANGRDESAFAGLILLDDGKAQRKLDHPTKISFIRIIFSESSLPQKVSFSENAISPFPFKGRNVQCANVAMPEGTVTGQVIATAGEKPLWTASFESALRFDTCWVPVQWIQKGDCVFEHLNGDRFMDLLPLVEWMRWLSGWEKWEHPPLRACFMFDDPNLHAKKYGFIDFAELAKQGNRHHYHTSFATVPLDSYYVSDQAAEIFRKNPATLSFLVHGNNHIYRELSSRGPHQQQLTQMCQAIDRIERLKKKSGVPVSKVMAPPHGVCSQEMMRAMRDAGFESVCVSHGSARAGSPEAKWTIGLGASPVTIVDDFPVIPRFPLKERQKNQILIAAYLKQPIIMVGHHWDLAEGLDLLTSLANIINGLGDVKWMNMEGISRSNYCFTREQNLMHIRTLARRSTIVTPEFIAQMELETSWPNPEHGHFEFQCGSRAHSAELRFSVDPGSVVDLKIISQKVGCGSFPSASFPAVVRRLLVEMRDRSMPYFPKRCIRR